MKSRLVESGEEEVGCVEVEMGVYGEDVAMVMVEGELRRFEFSYLFWLKMDEWMNDWKWEYENLNFIGIRIYEGINYLGEVCCILVWDWGKYKLGF